MLFCYFVDIAERRISSADRATFRRASPILRDADAEVRAPAFSLFRDEYGWHDILLPIAAPMFVVIYIDDID
jgi:hypothetical protein